jgi:hypothetical protein
MQAVLVTAATICQVLLCINDTQRTVNGSVFNMQCSESALGLVTHKNEYVVFVFYFTLSNIVNSVFI